MLPTVLRLSIPLKGKTVLDIGCGDGFFTFAFADKAKFVYGLDNSKKQIAEAQKQPLKNVKFVFSDMFEYDYPKVNLVNVPFVLGCIKPTKSLLKLFKKIYDALEEKGKIMGIVDSPKLTIHNNKKFGSIKKIISLKEGNRLIVELYDNKNRIITLSVFYHTKKTIENLLKLAGFKEIIWHKPIVSEEGVNKFGKNFWEEYLNNLDIEYFTATKS